MAFYSSFVDIQWFFQFGHRPFVVVVVVDQLFSTQSCPTLWGPTDCSMPGFPVLHHLRGLLNLMSTESVMPSLSLVNFLKLLGWYFLVLWSLKPSEPLEDDLNLFCPFSLICSISLLFSSIFWRFPWVYLLNLLLNFFFLILAIIYLRLYSHFSILVCF